MNKKVSGETDTGYLKKVAKARRTEIIMLTSFTLIYCQGKKWKS